MIETAELQMSFPAAAVACVSPRDRENRIRVRLFAVGKSSHSQIIIVREQSRSFGEQVGYFYTASLSQV